MRWVLVAAVLATPAAAQSPTHCRALDMLLAEYIRAERAQISRDADAEEMLRRVMGIIVERQPTAHPPTRDLVKAASDALMEKTWAADRYAAALEALQHRARLCARQ